jgi:hypothetical protein
MEKISWSDFVRTENVLQGVKEARNILQKIRRKKANWIGHLFHRSCFLNHVIEGKVEQRIEVTVKRRQGRRLRSYWMVLRKRDDAGSCNKKL